MSNFCEKNIKLLTKWTWIYSGIGFFKFDSEILLLLRTRHRRFARSKGRNAKGAGSCASIGKRSMLSGNRGDFFFKYTADRGSRVQPVVAMCGWLVYEIVEAPDGVVGGTLETEAVLPCLGALKKWMGLATPARQPLHPAFSESFVCPPRISSISYSPISRPIPLLCRRRLPGAAIRLVWHLRLTVDFFKIQRSAWRAGDGAKTAGSSRGQVKRSTGRAARNACNKSRLRAFRSRAAGWSILCRRQVFCARYLVVLEDIASAVLPGWQLRPGCHAFFTVALGRSGWQGEKGGVARQSWYIFRIIPATLASPIFSPPPSVQTYVPSMRSACCTHIHRCIYMDTLSAAGANTAAA